MTRDEMLFDTIERLDQAVRKLETIKDRLQAPLKELLGHTRLEVLAGSCLGVAVSFVVFAVLQVRDLAV